MVNIQNYMSALSLFPFFDYLETVINLSLVNLRGDYTASNFLIMCTLFSTLLFNKSTVDHFQFLLILLNLFQEYFIIVH